MHKHKIHVFLNVHICKKSTQLKKVDRKDIHYVSSWEWVPSGEGTRMHRDGCQEIRSVRATQPRQLRQQITSGNTGPTPDTHSQMEFKSN